MEREKRQGSAPTDLGMNRTGVSTSPIDTPRMVDAAMSVPVIAEGAGEMVNMRRMYVEESPEPIGSMPPPVTPKGMAKTAVQAFKGHKPTVLLDKMGERLAFERTGTRLYDAMIVKVVGSPETGVGPRHADLEELRAEELRHFELVHRHLVRLGADPTVQTPCADTAGMQAMGVLQVLTDPRTTLSQCLNAILTTELADTAGWELLTHLAREAGETEMADEFQQAHLNEQEHDRRVKTWLTEMVMTDAGVA
ncbi:MAG TPA: ferritin-like domain-containing protein [Thermoanaerobaculia bacterium]|nr:ferritin-like domain-containing protein [Thermoanaerobaculia bacterium]